MWSAFHRDLAPLSLLSCRRRAISARGVPIDSNVRVLAAVLSSLWEVSGGNLSKDHEPRTPWSRMPETIQRTIVSGGIPMVGAN